MMRYLLMACLFFLIGCTPQVDEQEPNTTKNEEHLLTTIEAIYPLQQFIDDLQWQQGSVSMSWPYDYKLLTETNQYLVWENNTIENQVVTLVPNVLQPASYVSIQDENIAEFHRLVQQKSISISIYFYAQSTDTYNISRVIHIHQQIETVQSILKNTQWDERKIQMATKPTYKFTLNDVEYYVWLQQPHHAIELYRPASHQYSYLSPAQAISLYTILSGTELPIVD